MPFYSVPKVQCPSCKDNALLLELTYVCRKCAECHTVDIEFLDDKIYISKKDNDAVKKVIHKQWENKMDRIKAEVNEDSTKSAVEDFLPFYQTTFSGAAYNTLKEMKNKYKFVSIDELLLFCISTTNLFIKSIYDLPGAKVHLLDNEGNKTADIKKAILKSKVDFINEMQNRNSAQIFMSEMMDRFRIYDLECDKGKEDDGEKNSADSEQ